MGTGKTLMCLSLIVSTLHHPCRGPTDTVNISPITTDYAERSYPAQSNCKLREMVGFPQSCTQLVKPSLLDICADILAIHDHSAYRASHLPPTVRPLLNRQALYYEIPADVDCMREVKRRNLFLSVKKKYLANTTLVVVPAILLQQWRDEITKHVVEGTLRVLEVASADLPDIEELLNYDVSLCSGSGETRLIKVQVILMDVASKFER